MHQIEFSSIPIRVANCWIGAFEGTAEVEIDETGDAYIDRITLTADAKGDPDLILKRPRERQPASESTILFKQLEMALEHWCAEEIEDVVRDSQKAELGYGHQQRELV